MGSRFTPALLVCVLVLCLNTLIYGFSCGPVKAYAPLLSFSRVSAGQFGTRLAPERPKNCFGRSNGSNRERLQMGFFDSLFGVSEEGKPAATPSETELKPGWEELMDEGSGIPYYWNKETGDTTWEQPLAETPVRRNPVEEAKEAGITNLAQNMPDLYNGWFTGQYTYMGADGETERAVQGTNEINDAMLAAVQAAGADGVTKMEVSFPPVPNLEEVDFGTALNFQFSREIRGELGLESDKVKTNVRRNLVDFSNLHWARRLAAAFPALPVFIAHCDQTDKSKTTAADDRVWVGPLSKLPPKQVAQDQVLMVVNPGPEEQWRKAADRAGPGSTLIFLNSISGGWTYELGGPIQECECVYYLKRISKGWVFRQYPGPWQARSPQTHSTGIQCSGPGRRWHLTSVRLKQALVEAPDGSVICLKTYDKKPPLREAAKVVREFSFSKFSIFNDRYAQGFGARL